MKEYHSDEDINIEYQLSIQKLSFDVLVYIFVEGEAEKTIWDVYRWLICVLLSANARKILNIFPFYG